MSEVQVHRSHSLKTFQVFLKWTVVSDLYEHVHNSEGNTKTRQMTPFFPSPFSTLTVTFISEFANTQN